MYVSAIIWYHYSSPLLLLKKRFCMKNHWRNFRIPFDLFYDLNDDTLFSGQK